MSRTIVHTPYWVLMHTGDVPIYEDHDHRHGVCSLKTLADYRQRFLEGGKRHFYANPEKPCELTVAGRAIHKLYSTNAPRQYRRSIWEKPARQHSKQTLAATRREYNSGFEIELEPKPYRTRNQANYAWS